jgi:Zn-dependent protease with chaperone function
MIWGGNIEVAMKLIKRGFSFRINVYILVIMIAFAFIENIIIPNAPKFICAVVVILCAIVSLVPALYRTTKALLSLSLTGIRGILSLIFKRSLANNLRRDELLNDIQNLCDKMEIKKKVKLKIVPNFINAMAMGHVIIFGKPLLEKLDQNEIKAIIAHELAHIKLGHVKRKEPKQQTSILIILFAMIIFLPALLYISTHIKPTSFTLGTLLIGIMSISFRFVSWPKEYEADIIANQYVTKDAMKSVWLTLAKMKEMDINWAYYSHPSISNRIKNLDWPQNVRNKKWYWSLD